MVQGPVIGVAFPREDYVAALTQAERAMHAYLTNPGIGDRHDRAIGLAKAARQGASALLAEIESAER